jgi:hypothetical protein
MSMLSTSTQAGNSRRDGHRGQREHRRHPHGVHVQQGRRDVAAEGQGARARQARRPGRRSDEPPADRGGHKQHADEQQAAAQEHRGEEAVLVPADPVPGCSATWRPVIVPPAVALRASKGQSWRPRTTPAV